MKRLVLAILTGLLATAAHAAPVLWTLNNVTFFDGGAASGSFSYDIDTNTFTTVSITTTLGTIRNGDIYTAVDPLQSSNIQLFLITSPLGPALVLSFNGGLSDFGGTITLTSAAEGTCSNPECDALGAPLRFAESGDVSAAAAVPEPASWALLLSGALLAGVIKRRAWRR